MEVGLLALRVVVGALFVGHGTQKLFGWFGGHGLSNTGASFAGMGLRPPRAMAALAGAGELSGGLLFALGLLVPLAAALMIAVMAMAIAIVHWRHGPWITEGGFEYNLVLIAAAFAVTAVGPGKWSLDRALDLDLAGVDWAVGALCAGLLAAAIVVLLTRVKAPDTGPRPAGA